MDFSIVFLTYARDIYGSFCLTENLLWPSPPIRNTSEDIHVSWSLHFYSGPYRHLSSAELCFGAQSALMGLNDPDQPGAMGSQGWAFTLSLNYIVHCSCACLQLSQSCSFLGIDCQSRPWPTNFPVWPWKFLVIMNTGLFLTPVILTRPDPDPWIDFLTYTPKFVGTGTGPQLMRSYLASHVITLESLSLRKQLATTPWLLQGQWQRLQKDSNSYVYLYLLGILQKTNNLRVIRKTAPCPSIMKAAWNKYDSVFLGFLQIA